MKPGQIELVDEGIRVKEVINGENYYLYIAPKAILVTCPRENAPDMSQTRDATEGLAKVITKVRGGEYV
jgi:hypothetical protein